MTKQYCLGDTAYIVESAIEVREVIIHNISGDFYTLRFTDSKGGIKVRGSRLFSTREAADSSLPNAPASTTQRPPHPHLDESKYRNAK